MMYGRQSGLGRGLGAIIPPKTFTPTSNVANDSFDEPPESLPVAPEEAGAPKNGMVEIPIGDIERNPHQPRVHFDHAELEELISSIKEHGILQPLVVCPFGEGKYQLIAGERRLRAMGILGYRTVPVVIRDATEQQKLELALIENIQRQDLNALEEAQAYVDLAEEFGLTQEEIARKVGKSRPQVANTMRLLQLPAEIKQALIEKKISPTNARTLLSLPTDEERLKLFYAMLENQFTVRQTEARAIHRHHHHTMVDPNVVDFEDRLRTWLHCKVQIKQTAKGEGEIRLKYHSPEEFQALLEKLGEKGAGV